MVCMFTTVPTVRFIECKHTYGNNVKKKKEKKEAPIHDDFHVKLTLSIIGNQIKTNDGEGIS